MSPTLGAKLQNYANAAGWAVNGLAASAAYTLERPAIWGLQGIGSFVDKAGPENLEAFATALQQSSIPGMEAGAALRGVTLLGKLVQARFTSALANTLRLEQATARLAHLTRLAIRADQGSREAAGLLSNYAMMDAAGWRLLPKSFTYGSNWGLDAVFSRQVRSHYLFSSTEYAALESKASGGLYRLNVDTLGIQQGSWDYIATRLGRHAASEVHGFDLEVLDVWTAHSNGSMRSFGGFGDALYELDFQRTLNASSDATRVIGK